MSDTHHEDQEVRRGNPKEGYDHSEPKSGAIALFAIGSLILLVITIFALQQYFDKIWQDAVYEKVLAPPSEELKQLHYREDWQLTHYQYVDPKTGVVRIPLDRATELFMKEAAAGKLFYPAKATAPKKEEPVAAEAPAGQAPAPAAAPPAAH